jgi:hypothetical protein
MDAAFQCELQDLERLMALDFGLADNTSGPYAALPSPTSIRVLEFSPSDSVHCSLRVVDLDDLPVYCALSYTWGNPRTVLPPGADIAADCRAMKKKYPIICNNQVIEVTANCYYFIQHFLGIQEWGRSGHDALGTSRYIWIDSLSINQGCPSERASQVSIMDRIYRQAKKLLIWLGDDDSLTNIGVEMLELFACAHEAYRAKTSSYSSKTVMEIIGTKEESPLLRSLGMPPLSWSQWQAVVSFYRRSWFSRSWTVQEFALARDAHFVCGRFVVDWRIVYSAATFLYHSGWAHYAAQVEMPPDMMYKRPYDEPLIILVRSHDIFHESFIRLVGLKRLQNKMSLQRWGNSTATMPLQAILGLSWANSCTNPADRVYAYLGTVPRASWQGLTIDYIRPVEMTYLQATWVMIKCTDSLRILSFVETKSGRQYTDLPSWVPDYSARRAGIPLESGYDMAFGGHGPARYNATSGTNFGEQVKDTLSPVLAVRGHLQSTVVAVPPAQILPPTYAHLSILLKAWHLLQHLRRLPTHHFWRTIISDEDLLGHEFPASTHCASYVFDTWLTMFKSQAEMIVFLESTSATGLPAHKEALRKAFVAYAVLSKDPRIPVACAEVAAEEYHTLPYETMCRYIQHAFPDIAARKSAGEVALSTARAGQVLEARMGQKTLFMASGDSFGKGPALMRAGDQVWLLRGARVPYVLRPLGDGTYEFLGEAYVHGIMQGEALDKGNVDWKTITLV